MNESNGSENIAIIELLRTINGFSSEYGTVMGNHSQYGVWRVKTVGLTRMVKEAHSLQMLRWKLASQCFQYRSKAL